MKKLLLIVASILLIMTVATDLFAVERGRDRGYGKRHWENRHCEGEMPFLEKLDLTKEQTAKIRALCEAHLRDVKPLQDRMFSKRGDLKLLWLQTTLDKEKILAVRKEIRGLRDQIEDKAIAHRVDVFNILTPEQKGRVQKAGLGHVFGPCMGGGMMGPGPGMMGHGEGME